MGMQWGLRIHSGYNTCVEEELGGLRRIMDESEKLFLMAEGYSFDMAQTVKELMVIAAEPAAAAVAGVVGSAAAMVVRAARICLFLSQL